MLNLFPQEQQMEPEKKKSYKAKEHAPRKCELESCGKEFVPKNDRAKYCSPSCNATASKIRTAMKHGMTVPALGGIEHQANPLFAIPPHAVMMIDMIKKECDRWEKAYDKEVEKREAAEKKYNDLKDEVAQDENPKGLQGFVQNNTEIISKALDHLGPVLAGWLTPKNGAPSPKVLEGAAEQQLTGNTAQYVKLFAEWMAKLNEQSQANVWHLLSLLADTDEEKMNYSILSLVQQWH